MELDDDVNDLLLATGPISQPLVLVRVRLQFLQKQQESLERRMRSQMRCVRSAACKQIHGECCASDIMTAYRNAKEQSAAAGKAFSVLCRKGGALWKEVMQKFKPSQGSVGRSKRCKTLH